MTLQQNVRNVLGAVSEIAQSEEFEQFRLNTQDFVSARERGESSGTQIAQMTAAIGEAAEILNRSFSKEETPEQQTNIISPVVVPRDSRSWRWVFVAGFFGLLGLILVATLPDGARLALAGPHYWLIWIGYVAFSIWRNSYVMIPDGCQALITRFGKVEATVGAGRTWLIDPWKRVSYIVNTTKEYPYNAPIREAPTSSRINASVDLFLQFRIEEPGEFIFTLGGVNGFSEKLHNAISEVTRALIYEQKAADIYDLVGETTQSLVEALNNQFLPAVRFVNANITHAEPSSQEYRMDLAAAEVVRVAKEAYTYEYELKLRKEQDEGDLNKELASLREELSGIRADIAKFQAQINTAREREINRANAYARQLMIEAESEAQANAALLEAQALDIRAVSSAFFPEILEYRYEQDILSRIEETADKMPQIVNVGGSVDSDEINFMAIARQMMGLRDAPLYTETDLAHIRANMRAIMARIKERSGQINQIQEPLVDAELAPGDGDTAVAHAEVVDEIIPDDIDEILGDNGSNEEETDVSDA
jgi:regulator of protease activity HflC (stomatin/prohibitin superfamily)